MIKSLVSPRDVVFRFPFQLEVDWAFHGRSAVRNPDYICEGWRTRAIGSLARFPSGCSGVKMTEAKCTGHVKSPLPKAASERLPRGLV